MNARNNSSKKPPNQAPAGAPAAAVGLEGRIIAAHGRHYTVELDRKSVV